MKKRSPYFKLGDPVIFEMNPTQDNTRWDLNIDKGYSGKFVDGVVIDIDDRSIIIVANFPDRVRTIVFPNIGSSDYEEGQWDYPGYLRLIEDSTTCDCGCGDGSTYHWNFCQRNKYQEPKDKKV